MKPTKINPALKKFEIKGIPIPDFEPFQCPITFRSPKSEYYGKRCEQIISPENATWLRNPIDGKARLICVCPFCRSQFSPRINFEQRGSED